MADNASPNKKIQDNNETTSRNKAIEKKEIRTKNEQ